jgi:hypothetical protein
MALLHHLQHLIGNEGHCTFRQSAVVLQTPPTAQQKPRDFSQRQLSLVFELSMLWAGSTATEQGRGGWCVLPSSRSVTFGGATAAPVASALIMLLLAQLPQVA